MATIASRLAVGSAAVCFGTWLALAATAGNVGLQRSISKGPTALFEQPAVVAVVAVVAFALALGSSRLLRLDPVQLSVGVVVGDLLAGLVLAPLAVGELEPIHAPLVIAAVSLLGIQPLAVVVGAWAASLWPRDMARH
jgi:hypothetical protein